MNEGLNLMVGQKEPEAYASMEWIIPTAVGIFIAKSYFDGFLSEAGKDHYVLVKNGIKLIASKCKQLKMRTLTSESSEGKVNNSYTQSGAIFLIIETKQGKNIKLLFDNELTKEDWDNAIDMLFEYVIENYEKHPNDKLSENLKELEPSRSIIIYAIIDKETKKITFADDSILLKKAVSNSNNTHQL